MNQEHQKTDALSDAVEIPEGATHSVVEHGNIDYIKHECGNWYVWQNKDWARLHPIVVKSYIEIMVKL